MTSIRDHIFVNYATEDGDFAEWLTLKLTNEGYLVWCDRIKLLGGESYPKDIDKAIKERTYRFLALLSNHSIEKPNPVKERTLALNLSRKRDEDFIIPLNLDGVSATDLDWMMSDLSYISFHKSWAQGLAQLLKKLRSVRAPRPLENGKAVVAAWASSKDLVVDVPERLWTNVLDLDVPDHLFRLWSTENIPYLLGEWPHFRENDHRVWVFEIPDSIKANRRVHSKHVEWKVPRAGPGLDLRKAATVLVRKYLDFHLAEKGLVRPPTERGFHFPIGVLENDKIRYRRFDGRRVSVNVVGRRSIRGTTAVYHLSPRFIPKLYLLDRPVVLIHFSLRLTDEHGNSLPPRSAFARRKTICRAWWNNKWLALAFAGTAWLTNGQARIQLALTKDCDFYISAKLRNHKAPVGIDEKALGPIVVDEFLVQREDDLEEAKSDE